MMDHKDLQDQLVDYLYDELDADAKAEFERALADDEEIRLEVEAFQQTRQAFGEMEEFDVPSAISAALMEEAARAAPSPVKAPGFWEQLRAGLRAMVAHPAMGAAAVMIAVIGMSFYAYRHGAPPTSHTEPDRIDEALGYRAAPAAGGEQAKALAQAQGEGEASKTTTPKDEMEKPAHVAPALPTVQADRPKEEARQAARAGRQQLAGNSVGKIQVKTRDENLAPSRSLALKRAPRRRSRGYKKSSPSKRPVGSKGDSLDDLANMASERREGFASKGGGKRSAGPAAPTPKPATVAKAPFKQKLKQRKAKADTASWLALGRKAAAAGRCSLAFDYFTRALSSDGSLAGTVSDSLGRCRSQLGGKGPHVWLASRVQLADRRRLARRKAAKKKAPAKAKPQKAQPSSLK